MSGSGLTIQFNLTEKIWKYRFASCTTHKSVEFQFYFSLTLLRVVNAFVLLNSTASPDTGSLNHVKKYLFLPKHSENLRGLWTRSQTQETYADGFSNWNFKFDGSIEENAC